MKFCKVLLHFENIYAKLLIAVCVVYNRHRMRTWSRTLNCNTTGTLT